MKIQYASDLHLEFAENSSFLKHNPLIPMAEVLVLVGDIGYIGDENYSKHPFWDWVSDNFERCIVIPENHEFYKFFDVSQLYNGWQLSIRSNITCYYNSVIDLSQEIVLIGTTLWSNIEQHNAYFTERAITDFRRIKNKENNLSWIDFNTLHQHCLDFLQESIERYSSKKIVVATHHVPSVELMSPEFEGSSLNGAFVVELGRFIQNAPINYWIYGHSHRNIGDYCAMHRSKFLVSFSVFFACLSGFGRLEYYTLIPIPEGYFPQGWGFYGYLTPSSTSSPGIRLRLYAIASRIFCVCVRSNLR